MIRNNLRDVLYSLPERRKEIEYRLSGYRILPVFYYNLYPNWGDYVGPYLVDAYTRKKVVKSYFGLRKHLISVGSILEQANSRSVVWGSGFKEITDSPISKPLLIASVRGPLTRRRLIDLGIECPQLYGDPALLLPLIYPKSREVKLKKIGVVLHKSHQWCVNLFQGDTFKVINLETSNVTNFVDEICTCELILSSSLHGLIAADSYKIPNVWIGFKGAELSTFKFLDYYSSLGVRNAEPHTLPTDKVVDSTDCFARAGLADIGCEVIDSIMYAYEKASSQF